MFKSFFLRKQRAQEIQREESELGISFKDLLSQDIIIKTKQSGNKVIFSFSSQEEGGFEVLLDEEKCTILSAILQDFVRNKSLRKIYNLFEISEGNENGK